MILANLFGFGNPIEIAIIAGVALVLFGGTKIAGFGKSLGEGLKEFKKATHDENESKEVASTSKPGTDDAAPVVDKTTKVD
jgi:sec-independent protein translocase protein TatA